MHLLIFLDLLQSRDGTTRYAATSRHCIVCRWVITKEATAGCQFLTNALASLPVAFCDALDHVLFHCPILHRRSTSVQGIQRTVEATVKEERC